MYDTYLRISSLYNPRNQYYASQHLPLLVVVLLCTLDCQRPTVESAQTITSPNSEMTLINRLINDRALTLYIPLWFADSELSTSLVPFEVSHSELSCLIVRLELTILTLIKCIIMCVCRYVWEQQLVYIIIHVSRNTLSL